MQNNTFSGLYLRQNLIVLEEVTSTNDYLKELLANIKPLPEATAIMAMHQIRGRGQRGNTWLDTPNETLALSFVLYPKGLTIQHAFNLNMLICLGIQRWVATQLPDAQIKWPNDIYVNGKKIGGVLIENQLTGKDIRSSIIGIGINIKQRSFPISILHKATSFYRENPDTSIPSLEQHALSLLSTVLADYVQFGLGDTDQLLQAYNRILFRKDVPALYEIEGQTVLGIIKGVERSGQLNIVIDNEERLFNLKEVGFKP